MWRSVVWEWVSCEGVGGCEGVGVCGGVWCGSG